MTDESFKKYAMAITAIATWPLVIWWDGLAASVMWRWFIAEPFGVQIIGVAHAAALSMFIGYLSNQFVPTNGSFEEQCERLARGLLLPWLTLGIGWIIKQWM